MRKIMFISPLLLVLGMGLIPAPCQASGCSLSGAKLDCTSEGGTNTLKSNVTAFANAKTREILANPLNELERFEHPLDREKFRRSYEAMWKAANRLERRNRRKWKRNRMDTATYKQSVETYNDARESYIAAHWFYKALIWQHQEKVPE